jgi:hypothetical protein
MIFEIREKARGDRVGVEGGVEAWAGLGGHGGQPSKPGGQPWSRRGYPAECHASGLTWECTGVYFVPTEGKPVTLKACQ